MTDKSAPAPGTGTSNTDASNGTLKTDASKERPVSEHMTANYPSPAGTSAQKGVGRPHPELWKHAAAAALHCWGQHAHHMAKEIQLSDADYAAAIKAALKPNKKGVYVPHEAALFVLKTVKA